MNQLYTGGSAGKTHREPANADPIDSVLMQVVWSVGPHKHDKY